MSETDKIINTITDRLVNNLAPVRILLFGSRARGTALPDSDYDILVIVKDSPQPQYKRSQECYRLLRGVPVAKDIIVLTQDEFDLQQQRHSQLATAVSTEGKVLYEKHAA